MTLNEILKEWKSDSIIDKKNLDNEGLKISELHSKYIPVYAIERLKLKKLLEEKKLLEKHLRDFYAGEMTASDCQSILNREPPNKFYRTEANLKTNIDIDPLMAAKQNDIALSEEKINTIYEIIKMINQRQYTIRNTIEFLRWKADFQ